MTKKIFKKIKLQIKGGNATPTPPIGPALGSAGVNIMNFCKKFNSCTQEKKGKICSVIIHVYENKNFDFFIKSSPTSVQLLEIIGIKKGSKEPNKIKIGKISLDKIKEIAKNKISDLNCSNIESAISMIIGTARSMGIDIIY